MITLSDRIAIPVAGGTLTALRLHAGAADGPAVLAVHGITGTGASWLAVADALAGDATVIAVDLRGRGASRGLPAPFGLDAHVCDLLAVLDACELSAPVVTGHSLGAYLAARLAVAHPERVSRLVLVDGGLTIEAARSLSEADREQFMRAFLGPALARLEMTFPDPAAYRDWWATHPAIAGDAIEPWVLDGFAGHDLVGDPPALRSSVVAEALRPDGLELFDADDAHRVTCPAALLCAPRGLRDEPNPMQPLALAQAWADEQPQLRRAILVPDVNHYTIALGRAGAAEVAGEIRAALTAAA